MMFDLSLQAPGMILEPPTRPFESIVDGEQHIGVSLVGLCRAPDIDFTTVRERQTNVDLIEAACVVSATWTLHDDPARRHTLIALLKLIHMSRDQFPDHGSANHILKFNLHRCFHEFTRRLSDVLLAHIPQKRIPIL